jgi:hypothetical protein
MAHRVFRVAFGVVMAVWLAATPVIPMVAALAGSWAVSLATPALAQNNDAKPTEQAPPNGQSGQEPAKEPQKVDEFGEAQKALGGPAGNPECVWFGRRVISLFWQDDLDTAFRHLDLYDRFGCPSGHVQIAFRCLLHHFPPSTDRKANDSLPGWVNTCWLNPAMPGTAAAPAAPAPAASVPSPTTNR